MKSIAYSLLILCCLWSWSLQAQKPIPEQQIQPVQIPANQIQIQAQHRNNIPRAPRNLMQQQSVQFRALPKLNQQGNGQSGLLVRKAEDTGLPNWIVGQLSEQQLRSGASTEEQVYTYLTALSKTLGIAQAEEEFAVVSEQTDPQEQKHIRLQQRFKGIPVWGSEMILHSRDGRPYMLNGRYYPTPELEVITPGVSERQALDQALIEVQKHTSYVEVSQAHQHLLAGEQQQAELVIYHLADDPEQEVLAWHITLLPNLMERWEYFVDAQSGAVIHQYKSMCQLFHGVNGAHEHKACEAHHHATPEATSAPMVEPTKTTQVNGGETATALDLKNVSRTIDVYELGGVYYMIDASRDMHNASLSNFPNNPVGTIWSINAFNTSPATNSFNYDHLTSNNNNWNNRTAVSAHFNGGLAYSYFRDNFTRNSINGQGGNIVSFINVAEEDGSPMDNAFWNGAAIFYGNGNFAFNAPLAKAEDVAGHEMAHGVIQNTANLDYQNESGALNESYADIFGAMIDRDDWLIGEEIANPAVFPTGAMRDMEDPNNGGSGLNDNGWQPKHMDEFVNLPNTPQGDNGGVHINSGIVNRAYYLFATDAAVGKSRAEQVYYKALTDYLVRSSRFIDMRIAAVQAASDLHGSNSPVVQAAERAFSMVGIGSSGGNNGGTNTQQDIGVNPGQDFILYSDDQKSSINNALTNGTNDGTFSNTDHLSKPSITDDGSIILFIDADGRMKEIDIDWSTGTVLNEFVLEESLKWRNVATSRDGSKLAAVSGDLSNSEFDNRLFIFDFISGTSQWFELYNPTFTEGVSTGDVLFADVLEWDFSGQFVMYDAANRLTGSNGNDITYWDIGFIQVWDNVSNNFGTGTVSKLFSGLSENQSVGNPTFSKNSDYIVAFDLIEEGLFGTDNILQGVNIQTGDIGTIFELNTLGYPSYSKEDDQVIFSFLQNGTQPVIAIRGVQNNKIEGTGDALLLIEDAEWAVWFATGERDLTVNTEDLEKGVNRFQPYPNPFTRGLDIRLELEEAQEIDWSVTDLLGRPLLGQRINALAGENNFRLSLEQLPVGTYFIVLNVGGEVVTQRIIKQ